MPKNTSPTAGEIAVGAAVLAGGAWLAGKTIKSTVRRFKGSQNPPADANAATPTTQPDYPYAYSPPVGQADAPEPIRYYCHCGEPVDPGYGGLCTKHGEEEYDAADD